jgi:6-pyruvoyl-tetrahydropterin synthase
MYRVTTAIHAHFSHHVRGHSGPCISVHGHTWKFELTLEASKLDRQGFVFDFDLVHEQLLVPTHQLLDHSFAIGKKTFDETQTSLGELGRSLVASRQEILGNLGETPFHLEGELGGARNHLPGGIKVAVFPFTPTSERLAEWFYEVAHNKLADDRVHVTATRVYESLHPVATYAEYVPQ